MEMTEFYIYNILKVFYVINDIFFCTLGLRYKPQLAQVAWWQQTSTDMSSDQDEEEEDRGEGKERE